MIVYNMRYRGSIEYEKMLLNILNFHNEVNDLCEESKKEGKMRNSAKDYINACKLMLAHYESEQSVSYQWQKQQMKNFIPITDMIGEAY